MKITIGELKRIIRESVSESAARDTGGDTGSAPPRGEDLVLTTSNYSDLVTDGVDKFVVRHAPDGSLRFKFSGVYPEDNERFSQENTYKLKIIANKQASDPDPVAIGKVTVKGVTAGSGGGIVLSFVGEVAGRTQEGSEEINAGIVSKILDKVQYDENFVFPLKKTVPLIGRLALLGERQ